MGIKMGRKGNSEKGMSMERIIVQSLEKEYENFGEIINNIRKSLTSALLRSADYERFIEIENKIKLIQDQILKIIENSKASFKNSQIYAGGPPVIVRCKQWNDFKLNARNAKAVSYLFRVEEGVFQADALKNGMIYTYSGEIPQTDMLLKIWLSRELNVKEERIFEGVLAIG